ncbi:lipolytic enzyme, SGNH family [Spiroplasma litorale]|uniref:Lipolytic enzyme, SGNH family n=1 Tax=Spiroplasma litorale TaxID=216942 RepID=A0A0K1W2H0_9MOLU|nr:SGNH/GDSL hydrolase family protein [Spiroplasma litorale]AKX34368.1 lipolytic enzyme, SGNH family [Spiroplasma litorale]
MKKLLSFMLAFSMSSNVAITVVACGTNSEKTDESKTQFNLNNFYVIGDSLSDAGGYKNLAQSLIYSKDPTSKYKYEFSGNFESKIYENKYPSYSNGKTAVEWINNLLGFEGMMKPAGELMIDAIVKDGRNYAVGGAKASSDIKFSFGEAGFGRPGVDLKVDIVSQAKSLVSQHKLSSNDIVFMEMGGNDMFAGIEAYFSGGGINKFNEIINEATINIDKALSLVLKTGAKVMYMNSPDITLVPTVQGGELDRNGEVTVLSKLAVTMKDYIHEKLDLTFYNKTSQVIEDLKFTYKDNLVLFDLFKDFGGLINEYKTLFKNTFDKDVNSINNYGYDTTIYEGDNKLVQRNTTIKTNNDKDIDTFFYIDQVHPTRYVHQYIGKKIYNMMVDDWFFGKDKVEISLDKIN